MEICMGGAGAIKAYFRAGPRVETFCQKLVLVGRGEAGKTSLLRRLQFGDGEVKLPTVEERTVGIETHTFSFGGDETALRTNQRITFNALDFAGQKDYYVTHQMFLTPGSFFLLVLDLALYDPKADAEDEVHSLEGLVMQWVHALQARVPGMVMRIVATHTGSCPDFLPSSLILS